jgi:DNA polymerase
MTERVLQENLEEELVEIVGSLKNYIMKAKKSKGSIHNLSLRGDNTAEEPQTDHPDRTDDQMATQLDLVKEQLIDCRRCPLCDSRKTIVFGEGNPKAQLLFVGEGPGEEEDRQGRPFVGRAGQLLNKIIVAMGLVREDVYIANIVKCRPPGNRNPKPEEMEACTPFLAGQIRAIEPRVICALGSVAARFFLRTEATVSVLRGRFHSYENIDLMVTYHPAYLLRNPDAKKLVWEDMQQIMKRLTE